MNITDFEYNNEKLSDYGMMVCSFNGSSGTQINSSGSDITFHQVNSCGSNKFRLFASTYDSFYSATFQICKNPRFIHNSDEMAISTTEVSSIQRWLCRKQYSKFKITQSGYEHLYWNAVFSSKQIDLNGIIVGMELTLNTDAPFAYMDRIEIEKSSNERNFSFDIFDESDEEGYIYPDVEITFLDNGDYTLKNYFNNKTTKISNCSIGETITIIGSEQLISSSIKTQPNLAKDFNFLFPRIMNTYNKNKNHFECNLKCSIKFSYSPIRKVGL